MNQCYNNAKMTLSIAHKNLQFLIDFWEYTAETGSFANGN